MIIENVSVMVLVRNMDAALRFYRDILGFRIEVEEEDWVAFQEGFGLMLAPDGVSRDSLRLNSVMLCLHVRNVDAEYDRLIKQAVPFLVAPTDTGMGRTAAFQDSEGNLIQLIQTDTSSQ